MSPRGDLSLDDRLDRIEHKLDKLLETVTILKVKVALIAAGLGGAAGLLTRFVG